MADSVCVSPTSDDIAKCVLDTFESLPRKCKPLNRGCSAREWVPMSGIVLAGPDSGNLRCAALGTGMKCLPASKLRDAKGNVLHDSHAEIIAVRAFNRFLLDECYQLAGNESSHSAYVRRKTAEEVNDQSPQPFTLRDGISIHMYGSEAPCGDASMELVMATQDDATPWETGSNTDSELKGRGSFAELGVVRRKPARPDAPLTLSKSCTDKLTMYQYKSVLSSITSLLIDQKQAYISSFSIPASQHVDSAITRAFSIEGRLQGLSPLEDAGYAFHSLSVQGTDLDFAWSRRAVASENRAISSNVSAVYTPGFNETLINGVLQGRKLGDPKGASRICRRDQWTKALQIAELLDRGDLLVVLRARSYGDVKAAQQLMARNRVKEHVKKGALKNWTRNLGDEDFGLH